MQDCQWLAELHSLGLLRNGFVPPQTTRRLRDLEELVAPAHPAPPSQRRPGPWALPALSDYSVLQLLGEVGTDMSRWPSLVSVAEAS